MATPDGIRVSPDDIYRVGIEEHEGVFDDPVVADGISGTPELFDNPELQELLFNNGAYLKEFRERVIAPRDSHLAEFEDDTLVDQFVLRNIRWILVDHDPAAPPARLVPIPDVGFGINVHPQTPRNEKVLDILTLWNATFLFGPGMEKIPDTHSA